MSIVRIDERGVFIAPSRPHLRRVRGEWVVLIRPGARDVFAAMRWADWKNGRHDWYYSGVKSIGLAL